jgi:hypothetical protein
MPLVCAQMPLEASSGLFEMIRGLPDDRKQESRLQMGQTKSRLIFENKIVDWLYNLNNSERVV